MNTGKTSLENTIQSYLLRQEEAIAAIKKRVQGNEQQAQDGIILINKGAENLSVNPQKSFEDQLSTTLKSIFHNIVNSDSLESNFSLKEDVFDKVLSSFEEDDTLSTWFKEKYSRQNGSELTFNLEFEKLSATLLSNEVSDYQAIHNNFPNGYFCLDSDLVKDVYIQTTDHPTSWNSWIPDELDYT